MDTSAQANAMAELLQGTFVRLAVGNALTGQQYRLVRVVGVRDLDSESYVLGKRRVSLWLKVSFGQQKWMSEISFVSNSPLTEIDRNMWASVRRDGGADGWTRVRV